MRIMYNLLNISDMVNKKSVLKNNLKKKKEKRKRRIKMNMKSSFGIFIEERKNNNGK